MFRSSASLENSRLHLHDSRQTLHEVLASASGPVQAKEHSRAARKDAFSAHAGNGHFTLLSKRAFPHWRQIRAEIL